MLPFAALAVMAPNPSTSEVADVPQQRASYVGFHRTVSPSSSPRFAKLLNQLDLLFMDMARALGMAPQHPNGTLTRDSKPEDIRYEAGGGFGSRTVKTWSCAHW